MAVKHIPTSEVHQGQKEGRIGCGFNTTDKAYHWVNSNERITCVKNGCK